MDLPEIKSAAYFLENRKPHPKALIEGVLHKFTKEMMGGGSKTHKTWIQIDRALAIASGTPWLGKETHKAAVLFMNLEILEPFFMDRVEAICKARQLKLSECNLDIWHLRGHTEGYEAFLSRIEKVVKAPGYEFVVADPIYKLYGDVDENKAADVAKMLNRIEVFIQRQQVAISYSAHYAKGPQHEKYAIDRVSGSGVFSRDPDTITNITKHKVDGCFAVEFTLRNCAQVESLVVEWQHPVMVLRPDLDPKDLHQQGRSTPKTAALHVHEEDVLGVLPHSGLSLAEWQAVVEAKLGLKRRAFFTRKKALFDAGEVVEEGELWRPFSTNGFSAEGL